MKLMWTVVAMLLLASPALADLTVEYRENSYGADEKWMKSEVRMDRSRTQIGWADAGGRHRSTDEVMVIRADRHLLWRIDPASRNYYEYPWPDTAGEYPPIFPSQIEADAYLQTGTPDSLRSKNAWSDPKLTRSGRVETMRGIKVQHVRVSAVEHPTPKTKSNDILDLWLTVDYPQTGEIKRLLGVLSQHRDWWAPQIVPAAEPAGNEMFRPYAESFPGIPVRLKMSVAGNSWFAKPVVLCDVELTSMELGRVPDSVFEIPRGYKKIDTTGQKRARKQFLSGLHSPR